MEAKGEVLQLEIRHVDDLESEDDEAAARLSLVSDVNLAEIANAAYQLHVLHQLLLNRTLVGHYVVKLPDTP